MMTSEELTELKRANDIAEQRLAVEKRAAESLSFIACNPPMNVWQTLGKKWRDIKIRSMHAT